MNLLVLFKFSPIIIILGLGPLVAVSPTQVNTSEILYGIRKFHNLNLKNPPSTPQNPMASFFRASRKWLLSPFRLSWNFTHHLRVLEFPTQMQTYSSVPKVRSPFDSNIIRILRNEVQYQTEYAPPHEVLSELFRFFFQKLLNLNTGIGLCRSIIILIFWLRVIKCF